MNKITTFCSEISQQTLTSYEKIALITQNLAQRQILFYMHQWPKVPIHGTQNEENPSHHHGRMRKDG